SGCTRRPTKGTSKSSRNGGPDKAADKRRFAMKVLLTGASGRVAGYLRPMFRERYGELVLSDRTHVGELADGEDFRLAELSDFDAVAAACAGVSAIIHL